MARSEAEGRRELGKGGRGLAGVQGNLQAESLGNKFKAGVDLGGGEMQDDFSLN